MNKQKILDISQKSFKTFEQVEHEIKVLKQFGISDEKIETIVVSPIVLVSDLIYILENQVT